MQRRCPREILRGVDILAEAVKVKPKKAAAAPVPAMDY